MTDLEIRIGDLADAGDLGRLVKGFRDHLRAESPTDHEIELHLPRAIRDPATEFALAIRGGVAVGYTQSRTSFSIWLSGTETQLDDLFVAPASRGRSIGRALLRHALGRAERLGAKRLVLSTNERNEAAHAVYRAEGLAPVSEPRYPGGREIVWSRKVGA